MENQDFKLRATWQEEKGLGWNDEEFQKIFAECFTEELGRIIGKMIIYHHMKAFLERKQGELNA